MHAAFHLGTTQTLIDAIAGGRRIRLDAYVLGNHRLVRSLERAAERGAQVEVRLCASPLSGDAARTANRRAARQLRDHGVRVVGEPPFGRGARHDKIAIVDGRAFLDDRNWRSSADETVVVDERPGDARALRADRPAPPIASGKGPALAAEARLIAAGAGHDVLVATESFGAGPVADALEARARGGDRVRLLYNDRAGTPSAAAALQRLRRAGVEIRASCANHKAACVGARAWIGSANATEPAGGGHEWGLLARGRMACELRSRIEAAWRRAG